MSKTILIIDDHPDTMDLIHLSLQRYGYRLLAADSGEKGLKLAKAVTPDLILLDIMMPDMDGYQVCRIIRDDDQLGKVPIIMFSAKDEPASKLLAFNVGADDYLVKPTRPAELARRVEMMLNRDAPMVVDAPQPEEPAGDLVVVLAARGGGGSTTVALNLAAALAESGALTSLVDFDFRQGHVALYLNRPVSHDLGALLQVPPEEMPQRINEALEQGNDHLQTLLTRPHIHKQVPLGPRPLNILLDHLLDESEHVVIDLGQRADEQVRPLLQRAHHILVCLRPERLAIQATKQLVSFLQDQLKAPERLHALMVDFNTGISLPRPAVENFLGFPLLDVVPIYPEEMAHAVNNGQPLVRCRPMSPASQKFKGLAMQFRTVDNIL